MYICVYEHPVGLMYRTNWLPKEKHAEVSATYHRKGLHSDHPWLAAVSFLTR